MAKNQPKNLTNAEKKALADFMDWQPEKIVANLLWNAGFRLADLYDDGRLFSWHKDLPDPYTNCIRNLFRDWELNTPEGEERRLTDRDLRGYTRTVSELPTTIPTISEKSTVKSKKGG